MFAAGCGMTIAHSMDTSNPFEPPATNVNEPALPNSDTAARVPASIIAILAETRPWLRLLLGLVVTGMVLASAVVVGIGFMGWFLPHGRRPLSLSALIPLVLVLAIYAPPAIFLARSATSIRRLQEGGGLSDLEEALRNQKSLWKYLGLLALALILFYAIALAFIRGLHAWG